MTASLPNPGMIFAFDHPHRPGDVCRRGTCLGAREVLVGSESFGDLPMLIIRPATMREYLDQPIPEGWCIPGITDECKYFYEITTD